jgi:hypothetical protein
MSLNYQGRPARMRSVYGHNTGTTTEDVYVCPPNCTSEITFIHVVNGGSGNVDVEVAWYVSADSYSSHFLKGKNISAGEYLSFNDIDIILKPGDKITVTPASAGHLDTIITATEVFSSTG